MMVVGCGITDSDHIQAVKLSGVDNTSKMYWKIEGGSEGAG